MSNEKNGLAHKIKRESNLENQEVEEKEDFVVLTKFSSIIVDGLLDKEKVEQYNNNHNKAISVGGKSATEVVEARGLPPPTTTKRRFLNSPNDDGGDKEEKDFENQNGDYSYSSCYVKGGNGNDVFSSFSSNATSTSGETYYNFVSTDISTPRSSGSGNNESLIKQGEHNQDSYRQIQSASPPVSLSSSSCWSDSPTPSTTQGRSGFYSFWEDTDPQGTTTSLESASSGGATVSFLTEIEVKPKPRQGTNQDSKSAEVNSNKQNEIDEQQANSLLTFGKMETSEAVESSAETVDKEERGDGGGGGEAVEAVEGKDEQVENKGEDDDGGGDQNQQSTQTPPVDLTCEDKGQEGGYEEEEEDGEGADREDGGEEGGTECEGFDGDEDDEDDDTTTLSSEAVVDDIELILMPEMCHDMSSENLSPKLVRVTELKLNADDVFCDDDDEDVSGRHEFRSIVDEVCEEEEGGGQDPCRLSIGDDDVSSGSELISGGRRRHGGGGGGGGIGESSKSSSSSGGRRRRSTSGRINSGVQTDITAVDEPTPISSGHGFRKRSPGKSSGRLGIPGGSNGKKLNWKSELTLLPSKMKVKHQSGFNSFECNDERDQYSPRVAKFTSQDTLNLSSQFLKPSTLYRTRNLSRNLNQFASSESTFMLPMSSEQQLSSCGVGESSRTFRDRVSSSTSGAGAGGVCSGAGNFKGAATSYSAYQISSILSGSNSGAGGGGMGGMGGMGTPLSSARLVKQPHHHVAHQPLISGYSSGGAGHMMMMTSRHFRSSMPDLNAVNKSYTAVAAATMADSHRRRQPSAQNSKSIKHSSTSSARHHRQSHHHSSTSSAGGFRLQKRSSSDEETSSLIDESERCLRSSIDLLLTDELPSPGGACGGIGGGGGAAGADSSCFRSSRFGGSSAANVGGAGGFYYYSNRRSCSQPILNDQAYPPEMRDPSMGSPFLPRKLSDMRCSRWAKVILPNGHVAVVSVKETDEIQDSLTIHTDTGCVINLPFRKVVFAWRSGKR